MLPSLEIWSIQGIYRPREAPGKAYGATCRAHKMAAKSRPLAAFLQPFWGRAHSARVCIFLLHTTLCTFYRFVDICTLLQQTRLLKSMAISRLQKSPNKWDFWASSSFHSMDLETYKKGIINRILYKINVKMWYEICNFGD